MEYITKKDLIDCSTPDEFCFSLCCMECKTVWKSTPIRFSRAGKKPENENRKIIYDTLYDREKNLAFQKALNQAKEIFNICPICKRLVCDHCFLICDDLDMCVQFLASEEGVELSMHFQKKLGKGIFGGEGFIMQRLSGNGTAFVEIDGHAVEYDLSAGQEILISTGYLAAMEETCTMDVVAVKGVKNMLIGGEGIFNTVVKGPGKVILQTMPISKVAELLTPFFADKK